VQNEWCLVQDAGCGTNVVYCTVIKDAGFKIEWRRVRDSGNTTTTIQHFYSFLLYKICPGVSHMYHD
jgi:hypothetical protein